MKFSTELEILIESIKVSLLEQSPDRFNYLLQQKSLNWQRLGKMAAYHAIRPILYDAFQKVGFQNEYVEKLRAFCLEQTVMNLKNQIEVEQLGELFFYNNLRVLNYKGVLFNKILYETNMCREAGDIDILVHPEDAEKTLEILFENGYKWSEKVKIQDYSTKNIQNILNFSSKEVELKKKTFCIDFHWGLFEEYRYIKYDIKELFTKHSGIFTASIEKIFILLSIHHAGRDCWIKLKYVVDLLMFIKKYNNSIEWENLIVNLKEANLKEPVFQGLAILSKLSLEIHPILLEEHLAKFNKDTKTQELIIDYWEESNDLLSIKSKFRYLRIYRRLQNSEFSMKKYLYKYLKANSYPNSIEERRIITFPNNYPSLNLMSKLITIILNKK